MEETEGGIAGFAISALSVAGEGFVPGEIIVVPPVVPEVEEPFYDYPIGRSLASDYGRRQLRRRKYIIGRR